MNQGPLVVLGSGGHSGSVAEAAQSAGFLIDDFIDVSGGNAEFEKLISSMSARDLSSTYFALGIGTNHIRYQVHVAITRLFPQIRFPPIIHSSAWVSPSASISDGAVLLSHSSVGAHALLGVGTLLNSGASLDHHSTLGNFASLGPGARTGGNVVIGVRAMVGLQAGVLQGRALGDDCVVGANSLVTNNVPPLSVAIGSPCRVTRVRPWDESPY